jgi:proteasome accessory factor B
MAKREYIQRHLLIIKRLKTRPSSFEEIKNYLIQQQELTEDNYTISQRTFQRDIIDIYSIYGIAIKFNKSEGNYEVAEDEVEIAYDRIFESFELLSAINLSNHIGKKIILEPNASSGTEHLRSILNAIDQNRLLSFHHKSYWKNEPTQRKVKPLLIKEVKHRWYLVCLDVDKNEVRNFGLDRISNLSILEEKGKELSVNLSEYYQHSIGIETYEKAEKVQILCSAYQAQYFQSLPLHPSQKIINETKENCIIELFIHPTNEFIMELFKYNITITVTEPQWLVDAIKDRIQEMMMNYK